MALTTSLLAPTLAILFASLLATGSSLPPKLPSPVSDQIQAHNTLFPPLPLISPRPNSSSAPPSPSPPPRQRPHPPPPPRRSQSTTPPAPHFSTPPPQLAGSRPLHSPPPPVFHPPPSSHSPPPPPPPPIRRSPPPPLYPIRGSPPPHVTPFPVSGGSGDTGPKGPTPMVTDPQQPSQQRGTKTSIGRTVGWAFLGSGVFLQVILGAFLVYKRRQLQRIDQATEGIPTSSSSPALLSASG